MRTLKSKVIFLAIFFSAMLPFLSYGAAQAAGQESEQIAAQGGTVVPAGTRMQMILNNYLNTRDSRNGDTFYALVDFPIFVGRTVAIPADSIIKGTVVDVERAGRIRGRSRITLSFQTLTLINGISKEISAEIFSLNDAAETASLQSGRRIEGPASKERDAAIMVGAGARGATIGAIAGGAKGLAIGSAAGGIAGLTILLANRGRDVFLDRGLAFELVLEKSIELSNTDIDFSNAPVAPDRKLNARESYRPRFNRERRYFPPYFGIPWYWPHGYYFPW